LLIPNFDGPTVLTKFGIMFLRAPTSAKYLWMSQRIEKKGGSFFFFITKLLA